jgi:hypothetical protein
MTRFDKANSRWRGFGHLPRQSARGAVGYSVAPIRRRADLASGCPSQAESLQKLQHLSDLGPLKREESVHQKALYRDGQARAKKHTSTRGLMEAFGWYLTSVDARAQPQ